MDKLDMLVEVLTPDNPLGGPAGVAVITATGFRGRLAFSPGAEDAHWIASCGNGACHAWRKAERHGLAFHGELFNRDDLRQQLQAADDLPLADILSLAWQRWSLEFVVRLDGAFAMACWHDDHIHLYRDPSGARALYFQRLADGGLAYATQLDALLSLPDVDKRLSRRGLHEYLRFLDIAAPNTPYHEVYALQPGQLLSWQAGKREQAAQVTVWTPAQPHPADHDSGDFEGALDTLERALRVAIEHRLRGAERPAAFLSGGVDSALLCALAPRDGPPLTAVTVGFDGDGYDETPAAAAIAAHLGLAHRVLRFPRADYLRAFETIHGDSEQPMADPAAAATLLAFEDCRARYDVVLDGTGADEMAGLLPPRHVRVAVEHAARLPAWLRRGISGALARLPGLAGYRAIFDFEHPAELMIRWRGFTRAEIESLCGEPVSFAHTHFFQTFARFPRKAHFARYSALLDAMPSDRLHQAAALTGLDVRFPFLAPALNAHARALPVDFRYRTDAPKRMLRALLARHVPRELWDTPKHGFDFPLSAFLAAQDHSLVRRYLRRESWQTWQCLNPDAVVAYGDRFIAGEHALAFRVWALVVLASWLERHH